MFDLERSLAEHIWFLLHHHSLAAVFGLLTVEESGIPVPVPGDMVMMYLGYQVHRGLLIWWEALLSGVLATLVGSFILYQVGRRGGRPLLRKYGRYLHLDETRLKTVEGWLNRHGSVAVFGGRLIPGMRCASSFAAGTFGVPYPNFFVGTLGSAVVWWGLFLFLGNRLARWIGPAIESNRFAPFMFVGVILFSVLLPLYIRHRMSRERLESASAPANGEAT
jgi:membrane protein DedA with SNARE-associated domain